MRLLYDSKHFHIILICQWRGVICEMAEVTFVAETLRHTCEFLGYFTHIVFSYFVCGFCGFSGYCGLTAETAITAVYVFVFLLSQ